MVFFAESGGGSILCSTAESIRQEWGNHQGVAVQEIMRGRFLTEAYCYLDKLFDGIRWLTTRIYRASCALFNGFWWLVRLIMLMVVAFFHGLYEIIKAFGKWPTFFMNACRQRCVD